MGGCDFSTRPYSYDDVEGDNQLQHFNLAKEDTDFKVKSLPKHFTCSHLNCLILNFEDPLRQKGEGDPGRGLDLVRQPVVRSSMDENQ